MRELFGARELSTVAILVAEVLFFTWYLWPEAGRSHPFVNLANLLLIFKYSSIYGIAAIGAAIVIISGGIDLSPGAVIALTTVVTGYCFVEAGWPLWASAAAGLLVGPVVGLVSSWLIVRVGLPPFIATLGLMGIARGTAFIVTEARFYDLSARLPRDWHVAGVSIDWLGPIMMIALAAVFQILMTRYQWGRSISAVGGNEMAALFSGIRVGQIKTSAYVSPRCWPRSPAWCWRSCRVRAKRISRRIRARHHRVRRRRRRESGGRAWIGRRRGARRADFRRACATHCRRSPAPRSTIVSSSAPWSSSLS